MAQRNPNGMDVRLRDGSIANRRSMPVSSAKALKIIESLRKERGITNAVWLYDNRVYWSEKPEGGQASTPNVAKFVRTDPYGTPILPKVLWSLQEYQQGHWTTIALLESETDARKAAQSQARAGGRWRVRRANRIERSMGGLGQVPVYAAGVYENPRRHRRNPEGLHSDAEIRRMFSYSAGRADELGREHNALASRADAKRRQLEQALDNFKYAEREMERRGLGVGG